MENIIDKCQLYNAILVDLNNFDEYDKLNLPIELINKKTKTIYEIFNHIIEYCIKNNYLEKPIEIIVQNVNKNWFESENLINVSLFQNYLAYLIHPRTVKERL